MKKKAAHLGLFLLFIIIGYAIKEFAYSWYSPKIFVENDVYNFGTVYLGEPVEFYVRLGNKGNAPLKIANISTDCGCTVVDWKNLSAIEPEAFDSVLVKYNTDAPGAFVRKVIIDTNDKNTPLILYVQGVVNEHIQIQNN